MQARPHKDHDKGKHQRHERQPNKYKDPTFPLRLEHSGTQTRLCRRLDRAVLRPRRRFRWIHRRPGLFRAPRILPLIVPVCAALRVNERCREVGVEEAFKGCLLTENALLVSDPPTRPHGWNNGQEISSFAEHGAKAERVREAKRIRLCIPVRVWAVWTVEPACHCDRVRFQVPPTPGRYHLFQL